jgi:hypothetical protein
LNGKKFLWQAVVLLPFIKEDRLLATLDQYWRANPLEGEAKVRNALNRNVLFVHTNDCLAKQLLNLNDSSDLLADLPYTDTRGHGTTLFGRIHPYSLGGRLSVQDTSEFINDQNKRFYSIPNPACVSVEMEEPEPHPSRPFHACQLLPGHMPAKGVLDVSDHIETQNLKGFGGEPARRMILNVLQQKLEFQTQSQISRSHGPSQLSGPPAPRGPY